MEKHKDKFKVLFICTGNSCRSPMAEGILKKMLKENKSQDPEFELDNFEVSSAGISTLDGVPPSLFAMEVAKARNVDLTQHRSRQLNRQILKKADIILAMSDEHLEYIRKMDKKALEKTYLLRTFPQNHLASNEDESESVLYIKDPIGGTMDDYELCFLEMEKEIRRVFHELIRKAGEKNLKNRS
ncbi:MAG: low molecular weight protein arginine phosphatase [candidate division Zixibacteria bacterium]|nr:low molecular weight protein arginine phosphatase [candidate division Zixibacteria bacterium]